jgi:hypothetical protein
MDNTGIFSAVVKYAGDFKFGLTVVLEIYYNALNDELFILQNEKNAKGQLNKNELQDVENHIVAFYKNGRSDSHFLKTLFDNMPRSFLLSELKVSDINNWNEFLLKHFVKCSGRVYRTKL